MAIVAFSLNSLIDKGNHKNITPEKIHDKIRSGTIISFLNEEFGNYIDFSLLDDADKKELLEEWQGFSNAVDARRKFGVEHNGITLLLAYIIEGMQQRGRVG
ncbi:MAG: hypothetical protein ACRC67_09550 [Inquilinus sp.]|uniref:hypothetical protein n=1 Tax=Inquilinus sp. TaxID=1932117 RepID=UPI003F2BF2D7